MKAFELRMLLSRIDPNAEVLVTTADPKGHGSFANPICAVGQDRTVLDSSVRPAVERPVLVLHHSAADRAWAAKGHGRQADEPTAPKCCVHGTRAGSYCFDCGRDVE